MARRAITTYEITDDIDGSPIDPEQGPIRFYDPASGRALTIDLGAANAAKLHKALEALAVFVGHASKADGKAPAASGPKRATYRQDEIDDKGGNAALADFARANGWQRGRIPNELKDAFLDA